ncbi:PAS domain-containing protein [Streptomyces sp. NPDC001709]
MTMIGGDEGAPVSNNAKQGDVLQQRRVGRPSNVELFIRSRQDPAWLSRQRGEKRERVERSVEKLREKFAHRPLLALIVMLEERILQAHQSRSTFVQHVGDKRLTSKPKNGRKPQNGDVLHHQLGGRCLGGPEWWLAELIAKHCLLPDQDDAEEVLEKVARMWCAANGRSPDPRRWPEPFEAASEREISAFIDPLAEPSTATATETPADTDLPKASAPVLSSLLDGLPDALLLVDANGTVVTANSTARQAFDPVGTGLTGQGLRQLLPAFDIDRLPRLAPGPHQQAKEDHPPARMTARRTDTTQWRVEVHTTHLADGRVFHEPSFDGDAESANNYVGNALLMVVVRDLADTQALLTELVRQQRQTEMILRTASEGIIGVDAAGRVILVNPAAAATLGYRASELGGQSLHPLVQHSHADGSPLPYEQTLIAQTLTSGKEHRQRGHVLWTKDGRSVPVDLVTAPVHDGDQVLGAIMSFDVRQPLKTLAAVASRHTLLMTLMDQVLSASLKDLQAKLEELADTDGQPETTRPVLRALAVEQARLNALVGDVMDYQRLAGAPERLQPRTVALDDVVATAVNDAKTLMGGACDVRFSISASAVDIEADPARLSQALTHLIAGSAAPLPIGPRDRKNRREPTAVSITATSEPSGSENGGALVRFEVRGPRGAGSPLHSQLAQGLVRLHGWTLLRSPEADDASVSTLEVPSALTRRRPSYPPKPLWQATETIKGLQPLAPTPETAPREANDPEALVGFTSPLTRPCTPTSNEQDPTALAFEAVIGTPVRAVHTGTITRAEWSTDGYRIILTLKDGTDVTYHHLSSVARTSGQVRTGEHLGRVGTPNPVGDPDRHRNGSLHLTVRAGDGTPVTPLPWLREHGVTIGRADTEPKPAAAAHQSGAAPAATKAPTERTLTTRVHFNIPGAHSMPPIVMRTPMSATTEGAPDPSEHQLPRPLGLTRTLLVWPALDAATEQVLSDDGYRTAQISSTDEIEAQKLASPAALFVDPLTGPITRTALRALSQAATAAKIPTLVTAGLAVATREAAYGADPAVLLQAVAPCDSEPDPPRVLLIEEREEIAAALASVLTQRGMEAACASNHDEAVLLAARRLPNLVVMDLMHESGSQPAGIIDWLHSRHQLGQVPLVIYTARTSQPDLRRLASGEHVLVLAERFINTTALNKIRNVLRQIKAPAPPIAPTGAAPTS